MTIVEALSDRQILLLHQLYLKEWWTKDRTIEQTKQSVSGSQLIIGVTESDNLLGFARVLTDYVFKAIIFDLIVHADFRGQGIADDIVRYIKNHRTLSNVAHFELYCLPELFEFYRRHGFDKDLGGVSLMRLETGNGNLTDEF